MIFLHNFVALPGEINSGQVSELTHYVWFFARGSHDLARGQNYSFYYQLIASQAYSILVISSKCFLSICVVGDTVRSAETRSWTSGGSHSNGGDSKCMYVEKYPSLQCMSYTSVKCKGTECYECRHSGLGSE